MKSAHLTCVGSTTPAIICNVLQVLLPSTSIYSLFFTQGRTSVEVRVVWKVNNYSPLRGLKLL